MIYIYIYILIHSLNMDKIVKNTIMNFSKIFYMIHIYTQSNAKCKWQIWKTPMYHFERIERIARWSLKIIHLLHFLRKSIAEVERRNSLVSSPFTCRKSHDRPAQYCLRIMHKARARCIHTDNCSVNAYCNNVDATGYVNDGYWREYRPEKSNAFSASVKKRGFVENDLAF